MRNDLRDAAFNVARYIDDLLNDNISLSEEISVIQERLGALEMARNNPVPIPLPDPVITDQLYQSSKVGVNIPYLDFGNDIIGKPEWNKKSLAQDPAKVVKLDQLFRIAKEEGFGTVRFWLFPSLWHGVYDNAKVQEAEISINRLLSVAENAGVKLIPTLLSFNNWDKEKDQYGAIDPLGMGGVFYHDIINALSSGSDVIDYVDLINEPEWALHDIPRADPNGAVKAVSSENLRVLLNNLSLMCDDAGLRSGYGSASVKWKDANLLPQADVTDYHNYNWSERWFSADEIDGHDLVMGETDIPYRDWDVFLHMNKFRLVMGWFEPNDYRTPEVFRAMLQQYKQR